ncbi:substrate-binding domain-containing protein [Deinococcus roseus]|uniref:HTH cro/C1-type domain-containing protein n=1 Tax=Deinococcus roseus TaxID=392414 RepID=A0ABQ2DBP5_9DEIO|nr:substrate-binding domain-containing protein [Deinococcus roseus]GGJ52396.1 hypothetical protein GCM10008938_43030 [Deinococcus roseus]
MMGPELSNQVQQRREQTGLSRTELALRVGVSRQAIHSIEQDRYIPNTLVALKLAQVLGCRVEDLFQLHEAASPTALWQGSTPPAEGGRVLLASVQGTLYALPIPEEERFSTPADAFITLAENRKITVQPLTEPALWENTLLVAGCDPALKMVASRLDTGRVIVQHHTSLDSLDLLREGKVHAAGIHLYDRTTGQFNTPYVQHSQIGPCTLFSLWHWQQGLLVQKGNPKNITGLADLKRKEVRIINRPQSAGSKILLDALLEQQNIAAEQVQGYQTVATSHQDLARTITEGRADTGLAIQAVVTEQLDFIPLVQERFDLVVPDRFLSHPVLKKLLALLTTSQTRKNIQSLGGYDPTHAGEMYTAVPEPQGASQ